VTAEFWIVPEALDDLPAILAGFDRPWWVAGGWAIDLFLGAETREHEDVEISVLFDDQEALREAMRSWELHVVVDTGVLSPWESGDRIELPRHQLWARRAADAPWSLEILFELGEGSDWVYRRDQRIRRPLSSFGTRAAEDAGGLPIVAPEIQLLFKSSNAREKDEHDFASALPALPDEARGWLRSALTTVAPAHPWLERL